MTRTRPILGFATLRAAVAAATAALVVAVTVAGCAGGAPGTAASEGPGVSPAAVAPAGQRVVLRFDQEVVSATLADTAAARQFATLLPLTLDLRDPMGQAKSGPLPIGSIDHTGAETVIDPDVGGIYYVPDRAMIAIFYDDLGQTVPPPGLVRLGTIDGEIVDGRDSGVDAIDAAGNQMRLLIDLASNS